jgi:hypothetical protein
MEERGMKIHEAAEQVLKDSNRPMSPAEVHKEIVNRGLVTFGAKDPVAIVGQTLRRKCDVPRNRGKALFQQVGGGKFIVAD